MLPVIKSVTRSSRQNRITRRSPDHRKETQTAVVRSCLPFIRSGQNHLARHSERGKKTRQTEEEVGRQHQGMDRPGVWQVPEGSKEQKKKKKWRKLFMKSSVVHQRPSQLRDRWRWRFTSEIIQRRGWYVTMSMTIDWISWYWRYRTAWNTCHKAFNSVTESSPCNDHHLLGLKCGFRRVCNTRQEPLGSAADTSQYLRLRTGFTDIEVFRQFATHVKNHSTVWHWLWWTTIGYFWWHKI